MSYISVRGEQSTTLEIAALAALAALPTDVASAIVKSGPTTFSQVSLGGASMAIGGTVTSGTTGSILFVKAGPILGQDNANFFWDAAVASLRIGPTSAAITSENKLSVIGNASDYHGIFVQNKSAGTSGSTDIVAGNDLSTADVTTYADFGVNSSTNNAAAYTAFAAGGAYLYTSGQIAELVIGTGTSGKPLKFITGGTLLANERIRVTDSATSTITPFITALAMAQTALSFTITVGGTGTPNLQTLGNTNATNTYVLADFNATQGHSANITFYKSANGTVGTATVVASGDRLGMINFVGAQQTGTFATQNVAASISAYVDGTVTSGAGADMPGRIVFSTSADSSGTPTDRIIIDSAGVMKPATNDGVALGTTALSYADLFLATGGVINWAAGDATLTHSTGLITSNVSISALNFNVTGATVPANGIYLGSASNIYFAAGSTGRMRLSSAALAPVTDDGITLGTATLEWSDLFLASGGVINWANGNMTMTHASGSITFAGGNVLGLGNATATSIVATAAGLSGTFVNSTDSASIQVLLLKGTRATPTAADEIYQSFNLNNASSATKEFGRVTGVASTVTAGAEVGMLKFGVIDAGTLTSKMSLTISNLRPVSNDQISLGSSTISWSDLFLASGAVINFNNGNLTLTHAAGLLTLAGGQFNHGANTAYFTETDNGNSSTADTIDWTLSNKQKSTLTGNCTYTFTAPGGPCSLVLKVVQGAGPYAITWPAAVHWAGGVAPTLTATNGRIDVITFYYDGTTYFGNYSQNYVA